VDIAEDSAFDPIRSVPAFQRVAGLPVVEEQGRAAEWNHDLEFLLAETRRLHAAPSQVAHSEGFAEAVRELKGKAPELSDAEIALEVHKILVRLGDGHSSLWPIPNDRFPFDRIPVQFYAFSDGLYIVDVGDEKYDGLVGKKLSRIGGREAAGVLWTLGRYIPRDNFMGVLWRGPGMLRYLDVMRDLGFDVSDSSVDITVVDENGTETTMTVSAGPARLSGNLAPRSSADGEMPLWLTDPEALHWAKPLPEIAAVYVQWNSVRDGESSTIADFVQEVRRLVEGTSAKNLIIDVRRNPGGNNFLIWPMVRLIGWHSEADPGNRSFVVTGRSTFSACQNFVNFVDRTTDAVFVGEPSSSKPNFTGETTRVRLPYSQLEMSISSRRWQDSWPEDTRPFIPVDIPAIMKSTDYFDGVDPVMAALGEYLGSER
jgi:hypothetical protein